MTCVKNTSSTKKHTRTLKPEEKDATRLLSGDFLFFTILLCRSLDLSCFKTRHTFQHGLVEQDLR